MRRFLASLWKEALVLARDRAGLIVLFVMPTALILIATLVQEGTMKRVLSPRVQVLFLDRDGGEIARALAEGLAAAGMMDVVREIDGRAPTVEEARAKVAKGQLQGAVVVAEGTTSRAREQAAATATAILSASGGMGALAAGSGGAAVSPDAVTVILDPVLPDTYRKLIAGTTEGVLRGLEAGLMVDAFAREGTRRAIDNLKGKVPLPPGVEDLAKGLGSADTLAVRTGLVPLRQEQATQDLWVLVPSSTQQNVPAWSIFAMFLIVIPLAGSLIRERQEGTRTRLRMLPGTSLAVLLGKGTLYLGVCVAQFGLMLVIGGVALPLFGTPALEIGSSPGAVALAVFATAAAAVGFGMAVGAIARTPEQASVFGATMVVIAGAVGGIMFPAFAMGEGLKSAAAFSPLGWAQSAFVTLFVRAGDASAVVPDLVRLLAFSAATTGIALVFWRRRD